MNAAARATLTAAPTQTTAGAAPEITATMMLTPWTRNSAAGTYPIAGVAVSCRHAQGAGDSDAPRYRRVGRTTSATVKTTAAR